MSGRIRHDRSPPTINRKGSGPATHGSQAMNWRRYFWPVVGIAAVIFSLLLLWHELRGISLDDVWDGISAIPTRGWVLAAASSVIAYASLAGYDHIALLHIGKRCRGCSSPSAPSPPTRCRTT